MYSRDQTRYSWALYRCRWGKWLLTNFSLNPGTIYADRMAFDVEEVEEMAPLGLNSYIVMQASDVTHPPFCSLSFLPSLPHTATGWDFSGQDNFVRAALNQAPMLRQL